MRNVPLMVVYVVAPFVAAGAPAFAGPAEYSQWQEEEARQALEASHEIAVEAASAGRESQTSSEVLYGLLCRPWWTCPRGPTWWL